MKHRREIDCLDRDGDTWKLLPSTVEQGYRRNPAYPDHRQEYINILGLFTNTGYSKLRSSDVEHYFQDVYGIKKNSTYAKLKNLMDMGLLIKDTEEAGYGGSLLIWITGKGLAVLRGNLKFPSRVKPQTTNNPYREYVPPEKKHLVLERDKYRCVECGATNKETMLVVDHKVPYYVSHDNSLENLQTLCVDCNISKRDKTW